MTVPEEEERDCDALMSAITDEPVPDEARSDPGFAAEHAAALADVAVLRERLAVVGDALAAGPSRRTAVPLRPPRTARRRAGVALGAVAATVAAALAGGLGWLAVDAGQGAADKDSGAGVASEAKGEPDGGANASPGAGGLVACARLIVEGTVTAVDPLPGGSQDRVTVDVTRHIKPESGSGTVRFPLDREADPRLKAGDRVLVAFGKGSAEPSDWAVGKERARLRTLILQALPAAKRLSCGGGG